MFGLSVKEKPVTKLPIVLGKKVMEATNCLQFFLENHKDAKGLGEVAEMEVAINPDNNHIEISFFTDKDFDKLAGIRERALPGSEEENLSRPKDSEKKIARINVNGYWSTVDLYINNQLTCKAEVSKRNEGKRKISPSKL